ncbi:MAG: RagB/SusD family nutrient uptake outer membrane protein [Bacteroidota bacterium]|nr:RagB/SusD family nutrient uptake outer membrane protein [Bacteroidota bacterium]
MIKSIKKTIIVSIILLMGVGGIFQSCSFLDIDPYTTDLFTLDTIFVKKEYAQKYLNNVYSYMVDYGNDTPWGHNSMPWNYITDEALVGYKRQAHIYNYFCNNEMTAQDLGNFDRWDYFYEGIRKANTFIQRINACKEVSTAQRSEWIGEATFVKACVYFELMLAHGPVPIVPDNPVSFDTPINKLMVERNTWDECSNYVSNLLETAIKLLPNQVVDNADFGKPTKYAAMAVLSRLSLYTASPLYNGDNAEFVNDFKNKAGVPYLNPVKSMEKWAIAAANAKRLVDLKPNDLYTVPKMANTPNFPVPAEEQADFPDGVGGIDPYHSYADIFNGECALASTNKEILFSRQASDINAGNQYTTPGFLFGWGVYSIPQNLVDAYYMIDGHSIDNASAAYPYETGYTDNEVVFSGSKSSNGFTILSGTHKWYVNREMRFYATVAYNNSYFPSTSTPPDKIDQQDGKVAKYFRDSKSGKDYSLNRSGGEAEEYPMTGYLCRKFIHYEDSYVPGGRQKPKYNVAYRMAEVYLNYVEAMNELDKSYTINGITVSRNVEEMRHYFNMIRHRAGLPGITASDAADVQKMRALILRERQIEFAWENRRYFDLRRTKTAVINENAPVMGCDVTATEAEKDKFYNVIRVKERDWTYKVFTRRQTFLPIPKHEIDKNPNLTQMPGF